jgi:hypothetical protein
VAVEPAEHTAGIEVDAVGSDPGWVDDEGWVLTSSLTPALSLGFDGVHVDVEPYANPTWVTDQAGTTTRYLHLLGPWPRAAPRAVVAPPRRTCRSGSPPSSTVRGAARRRGPGPGQRGRIMAYRNTATGPDGTLVLADPTLTAARAAGTKARIGQETRYLGPSPVEVKQTFSGQTSTRLEAQLGVIDAAECTNPAYLGVAVNDHTGWAALSPGPPGPPGSTALAGPPVG